MRIATKQLLTWLALGSMLPLACKSLNRSILNEEEAVQVGTVETVRATLPILRCHSGPHGVDLIAIRPRDGVQAPRELVDRLGFPAAGEIIRQLEIKIVVREGNQIHATATKAWVKTQPGVGLISDILFADGRGEVRLSARGDERVGRPLSYQGSLDLSDSNPKLKLKNQVLNCSDPVLTRGVILSGKGLPTELGMVSILNPPDAEAFMNRAVPDWKWKDQLKFECDRARNIPKCSWVVRPYARGGAFMVNSNLYQGQSAQESLARIMSADRLELEMTHDASQELYEKVLGHVKEEKEIRPAINPVEESIHHGPSVYHKFYGDKEFPEDSFSVECERKGRYMPNLSGKSWLWDYKCKLKYRAFRDSTQEMARIQQEMMAEIKKAQEAEPRKMDKYLLFLSMPTTGDMGGLEGADLKCQAEAALVGSPLDIPVFAGLRSRKLDFDRRISDMKAPVYSTHRRQTPHPADPKAAPVPSPSPAPWKEDGFSSPRFIAESMQTLLTKSVGGTYLDFSTANGQPLSLGNGPVLVWTGGQYANDPNAYEQIASCNDWTADDSESRGSVGMLGANTKKLWDSNDLRYQSCSDQNRILCFIAVPAADQLIR